MQHHCLLTSNAKTLLVLCRLRKMQSAACRRYLCLARCVCTALPCCAPCSPRHEQRSRRRKYLRNLGIALGLLTTVALYQSVMQFALSLHLCLSGAALLSVCCFVRSRIRGRQLRNTTVAMVVGSVFVMLMAASPYMHEGEFLPIVPPKMKPPPHKRLFVGCSMTKGAFTLFFAALMIFLKDPFFGTVWIGTACAGSQAQFSISKAYDDLHEKIESPKAAPR